MQSATKRVLYTLFLSIALIGLSSSSARAQLGFAGGLNFDSVSDIETSTNNNATLENATGYHLGVVYDLGLGPVTLRPGVYYRKVGTYDFPDSKSDVSAWEVPVDIRLTVLPFPLVKPYVVGGPNAVFPSAEGEFDDELEDVSYTFNVGAGADISVPALGFTLQPELRYEFGATDYVSEEFDIGGTTFSPSDRKFSAFALRLHVIF